MASDTGMTDASGVDTSMDASTSSNFVETTTVFPSTDLTVASRTDEVLSADANSTRHPYLNLNISNSRHHDEFNPIFLLFYLAPVCFIIFGILFAYRLYVQRRRVTPVKRSAFRRRARAAKAALKRAGGASTTMSGGGGRTSTMATATLPNVTVTKSSLPTSVAADCPTQMA